jgi:hypothetical protein
LNIIEIKKELQAAKFIMQKWLTKAIEAMAMVLSSSLLSRAGIGSIIKSGLN